jgi:hypothetical protein
MDDIDRAQIGQHREVAHEINKHPAIPKTNLPPMRARGAREKPHYSYYNSEDGWIAFITFLIICAMGVIIGSKMIGLW